MAAGYDCAAVSLGRMWRARGQPEAARQLVSGIYERFTAGSTTADLLEAEELTSG